MFQGRRRIASWMLMPLALFLSAFLFFNERDTPSSEDEWLKKTLESRKVISESISAAIKANKQPKESTFSPEGDDKYKLKINYTLQNELQAEAESLLKRYRPDYAAIVMMDAKTGRILAMTSFEKGNPTGSNLALRASFPAASIFKVITASAAVDKAGVSPEHRIGFNGGNYTLYKKNVLSDKVNRWTRFITLKEAFARSINTAFGRLSLESLEPKDLAEYAQRFMFNQEIPADFAVETSQALVPNEKGFELTEVASGYNRFNTLSPVHGAMLASTIINDGKMMVPYIVDSLENSNNEKIYKAQILERGQILRPESAAKVRQMMEQTVLTGTGRKTFRKITRDKKFKEIEMGGKTGHFTGLSPKGRNDWFVGYASDEQNKIAVAAITVNVKKWTVKSSALGEMMFRKYFKDKLDEKAAALDDKETAKTSPVRKIAHVRKRRS
ncbi:MAG: penicillin-binding protein [Bdellovibrio sp.]|nr:penicillin-binding protein [Bdellovibrio sp.]